MNPLSGVLGEAWRMYKAHAKHLLAIAFVIYLVAAIIAALLALAGGTIGALLGSLVEMVAAFLLQATLVKAVQDVRDGRADMSIGETVTAATPYLVVRRRGVDPGRHRDHDRADPDHRARPVPDHHLGGDRAGHRHRAVRGAGVLRAQPPARPGPRLARVRHAGAGLHDPARGEARARPDLLGAAARAGQRPELGHLGHADRPVPRPGRDAGLLPARRRSAPPGGGPWAYQQQPQSYGGGLPSPAGQRPVRRGGYNQPTQGNAVYALGPNQPTLGGGAQQPPQGTDACSGYNQPPQGGSEPTQQVPRWEDPPQPR